ncbi:MAG: hypothetical protein ICV83_10130 [Cytophagales bacterium]|nr:hypothetical protein [Cytophagales bacterium]
MNELPPSLFGTKWVHAHEEDTPDTRVYRPSSHPLPPSRGRTGFSLREDGTLTYYGIRSTDGTAEQPGHWKNEGQGQIKIELENSQVQPFTLNIVVADDQSVRTKR